MTVRQMTDLHLGGVYLDGEMPAEEITALETHLDECPASGNGRPGIDPGRAFRGRRASLRAKDQESKC